jgi:hypothetical protein
MKCPKCGRTIDKNKQRSHRCSKYQTNSPSMTIINARHNETDMFDSDIFDSDSDSGSDSGSDYDSGDD